MGKTVRPGASEKPVKRVHFQKQKCAVYLKKKMQWFDNLFCCAAMLWEEYYFERLLIIYLIIRFSVRADSCYELHSNTMANISLQFK